jgi:hypothetical protein
MEINMKETFEEYLGRMHMEDEPMVLDDDLPDAYEAWTENIGPGLLVAHAERWHVEQLLANLRKVTN